MSSILSHLLQSVQNQLAASGAPAQNQQWTGAPIPPAPGYGSAQYSQPAQFNNFIAAPQGPVYGATPGQAGRSPYQNPNPYSAGQYLQPMMQPGVAGFSPGVQYPLRPVSAPPVERVWSTPDAPQPQPTGRPSGGFRDFMTDTLTRGFKKLDIGAQPSAYPTGGNGHVSGAEPRYHSFRLTPLPPTGDAFRLIEFNPVPTPQSPISCKMHTVNLQNHPEYIALSYPVSVSKVSGRFRYLEQIACNGGYIELYGGMLDILHSVLSRYDPVFLWIDCCCIAPHDPAEKAEQIAMMKHIYRKAKETVIWLEEPSDNAHWVGQAFETLRIGYTHFNNIETRQAFQSKWASTYAVVNTLALNRLLQKVYFSRSWMLQEAALSSHAVIYCCTYRIKWADFCEQLACLMRIGYIEMIMLGHATPLTVSDIFLWLGRHKAFVTLWRELEKQRRLQIAPTEPLPLKLKQLMRLTRGMNASDLRDRVYALLGLCSDGHEIRVDTRKQYTVAMLYHQLALYFIKPRSSRCDCNGCSCPDNELSFLGDAGVRSWNHSFFRDFEERHRVGLDSLPTWVPVFEYRAPRTMWTEAHSAGYKAGGRTKPSVWHDPDIALPRNLFAAGIIASRIQYITTPCPTLTDHAELLELNQASKMVRSVRLLGGWYQEAFNLVQQHIPPHHSRTEDFCRTLCANVSHMEADLLPSEAPRVPISNPRELARFFDDFMALYQFAEAHKYHLDMYTVMQSAALNNHGDGASKWLELTSFTMPYITFFLSDDGRMGLGPSLARVGDQIAVLNGAPMPAVLRSADQAAGPQYQVVGTTYVHGLMNGEAFELFAEKEALICLV